MMAHVVAFIEGGWCDAESLARQINSALRHIESQDGDARRPATGDEQGLFLATARAQDYRKGWRPSAMTFDLFAASAAFVVWFTFCALVGGAINGRQGANIALTFAACYGALVVLASDFMRAATK
jgi:hypothetical protein